MKTSEEQNWSAPAALPAETPVKVPVNMPVNRRNASGDQSGLTLVELLVVIVLIGIIMAVVGGNIFGKGEAAKADLNVVKMQKLKDLLAQYRLKYNTYPSTLNDLIKPGDTARSSGKPFIAMAGEEDLVDVWNAPYLYRVENNGRSFALTSLGSDSLEGGEGPKQDVTVGP